MGVEHLVKIGLMGVVGRYDSPDFSHYPRDSEVICRTRRGLESGVVLCSLDNEDGAENGDPDETSIPDVAGNDDDTDQRSGDLIQEKTTTPVNRIDGQLLRRVGSEDQMILQRLQRYRDKAFTACQKLIAERKLPAVLVDVEHLFDGESVYFYFMGDVDPQLERLTDELAATYESKVRFKKFAETLANGCGPDCGTKDSGCSTGGCGSCALSGGCGSKRK